MTDPNRPTGRLRALGLFVLVVGVMIMHAVVFGAGHGAASAEPHGHAAHAAHAAQPAAHAPAPAASHGSDCDDCGTGHGGMHGCVFVLSALALALGLALLAWVGVHPGDTAGSGAATRSFRRTRAPPWTVLSLPELSILRI
ncbi:DUF6153 family protein [Nocardia sp. CDC159]|uniref:DUF6153 family protein n=1 Tax=Nocardia pulmonis TaxID=2951408 RepID=A0A9X2EBB8_9NOCA|nr:MULTISPECIES: DUF6153 family protein [Nocardia]MCM6777095.1 DUF6153 family protein [Nocardia pulmonis]MCM6789980.1 DUF6153 family protein [Nocardia sp. CDC159]